MIALITYLVEKRAEKGPFLIASPGCAIPALYPHIPLNTVNKRRQVRVYQLLRDGSHAAVFPTQQTRVKKPWLLALQCMPDMTTEAVSQHLPPLRYQPSKVKPLQ